MTKQKRIDETLKLAVQHGTTDGGHHKMWVIDQMLRVLTGCPTKMETFKDSEGISHTYEALGESDEYLALIEGAAGWDEGIAP